MGADVNDHERAVQDRASELMEQGLRLWQALRRAASELARRPVDDDTDDGTDERSA